MCTEYLGKKIELKELLNVQAQDNSIRGYYLSFGDRYEICLLAGMNFCWRRFVACKELFHVILDDERYRTTDIYNHVEEVIAKFPVAVMAGSAVVSEALAEIAAMEFLFPYPDRRRILTAGSPDYLAIAQRYKIPQALVEEYLVDSFVKGLEPYMVKKQ
jgi:Zn-dependent peptidase ImmA (M78 family)